MTDDSFNKIKKLVKMTGGKAVIVEDGKPTMLIMEIEEYMGAFKNMPDPDIVQNDLSEKEMIERINKDINIWNSKQEERRLRQFDVEGVREVKNDSYVYTKRNGKGIIVERL